MYHESATVRELHIFCAREIVVTHEGLCFAVGTPAGHRKVHIPLLGRHQVYAALAAIAVGLAHEVDLDAIVATLARLPHLPGRLKPLSGRRGSLILDDSYSSSPAAAEAALETSVALEGRHKIVVLGDMLELGEHEAAGHEPAGTLLPRPTWWSPRESAPGASRKQRVRQA